MKSAQALKAARTLQLLNAPRTNILFHGYSMEPLLTEGDDVVVKEIAFDDIRLGDIIVSYEGYKYPARRVLYKKKQSLIVWRDNWAHRKIIEIHRNDVLGKLISRKRNQNTLHTDSLLWKLLTIWAFIRFVPGHLVHHCPPLKNYVEKQYIKRWRRI